MNADQAGKLLQANSKIYTLMRKLNSQAKRHAYPKFKRLGPCFYLVESGLAYEDGKSRIKFGIAGTMVDSSLDDRLAAHRTLWPTMQVKFAVFSKASVILEQYIKQVYEKQINPNGHEIIEGVDLEPIISIVRGFLSNLGDLEFATDDELAEYNSYVSYTLKEGTSVGK